MFEQAFKNIDDILHKDALGKRGKIINIIFKRGIPHE